MQHSRGEFDAHEKAFAKRVADRSAFERIERALKSRGGSGLHGKLGCVKIHGLHHILLPVRDVARAAEFYRNLGMEPVSPINPRMAWMQFGGNQLHLWLDDEKHVYNGWTHEPSPHFALAVDDVFEFEKRIPQLGGQVVQAAGQRPSGTWYLFALDTEGNRFELMETEPR